MSSAGLPALYPDLRRFASMVASADVDPDDLVQEAMAKVLAAGVLPTLDNPGAYLRRTILNLERSHRRRWARWRERVHRLGVEDTVEQAFPSDLRLLDHLGERDRALLYLTAVEGYPYAAAAELLGGNEQTLRSRASKARAQLRTVVLEESA